MAECNSLPTCPFFNDRMPDDDQAGLLYKMKYCHADFESCARYQVESALGRKAVPAILYPNMQDRAQEIIASASVPA